MHLTSSAQSSFVFWGATICFSIGALIVGSEVYIQHKHRTRAGWIALGAAFFCGAATFFNGVYVGFQDNRTWIWSGFLLGCLIGFTWSASLALLLQFLGRFLMRLRKNAPSNDRKSNVAKRAGG